MFKYQVRSLSRQSKSGVYQIKRYSSSSAPPPNQDQTESSNNLENDQSESPSTANSGSSTNAPLKSKDSSKLKKRIRVQASVITPKSTSSMSRTISLPSVPSTQYLDTGLLRKDMFYGGFMPLLTPVRKPTIRSTKKPTIPPTWNISACRLETFDDYSNIPQFVVDKLTPFNIPQGPGNEIRLGLKSRKEEKESEKLSKEVLKFIKHFRK